MKPASPWSAVASIASIAIVIAAFGASCGPVAPAPPSLVPVNACPPDSCGKYAQVGELLPPICNSGQCTSNNGIDFTLVVSRPETSFSAPGTTVAIPQFMKSYLPGNQCGGVSCAFLPTVPTLAGIVTVDQSTELCARRTPDSPSGAILPVTVEFLPQWPASLTQVTTLPADTVGLPLIPLQTRTAASENLAGTGPGGTPPTQWSGLVPRGTYEEDIVPLDPNYPPRRMTVNLQRASLPFQSQIAIDPGECAGSLPTSPPATTTFNVKPGTGSLAGFSVYVRDGATLRRISSLATLAAPSGGSVTILTSGELNVAGELPSGSELVVTPPAGIAVPTYADTVAPVATLADVSFPPLPAPVTVSGAVVGPLGIPIDADLVIDSTPPTSSTGGIVICSTADCTSAATGTTQRPLSYSTTAHATKEGGYSVALPPGDYDVFVVPAIGSGAGAASVPLGVQFIPGQPPVAAGKTLRAAALATVSGTVALADGRPLVGATVEVHAAAISAGGGSSLAPINPDPRRWPRAATGVTDAAGGFSFSADPGTYDVVVRPEDGTGFPWLTIPSQPVAAGGALTFSPPGAELVVPAPIAIQMTLEEPQGQAPVAGAIVRAYYPLTGFSPPSTTPAGAPPPEVQLGVWLTDSAGHFTMYIVPPE